MQAAGTDLSQAIEGFMEQSCLLRSDNSTNVHLHRHRALYWVMGLQAEDAEAAVKSLEAEVRRLQEEHAARSADLTSRIAGLTAEKAAVERRMAAQVRIFLHTSDTLPPAHTMLLFR